MEKLLIVLLCIGSLKAIPPKDLYKVTKYVTNLPTELACICLGHDIWNQDPNKYGYILRLSQLRELILMKDQTTEISPISLNPQALHTVIATTPLAQTQPNMQCASEVDKSRKLDNRPNKQNINNQKTQTKTLAKAITKLGE